MTCKATKTIAFQTVGCRLNQYETEKMAADLAPFGFERVDQGQPADLYIINTCTVTHRADKDSRYLVRRAKRANPEGRVVLADINDSMLQVGRDKLLDTGHQGNIEFVQADAQFLPFPDDSFDCITIAFGLRNVTHKEQALASMLRVLKPGGRLLVLEFSKPANPLLEKVYDGYSFGVLPAMGKLITDDADSYRYLAESIRKHPDQETLKTMMSAAGYAEVEYHNMTGGIVALHRGVKR